MRKSKQELLNVESLENCWKVLSDIDMSLNLRFTGSEYTDCVLTEIQELIKLKKEHLKVINEFLEPVDK